jgi:hypothetical protein
MAVGEDVGFDTDHFPDDAFGGKASAVDLRLYTFDDDPATAIGAPDRAGDYVHQTWG